MQITVHLEDLGVQGSVIHVSKLASKTWNKGVWIRFI